MTAEKKIKIEEKIETKRENTEIKKLYRSKNDRIIAGVCSGLAKYFKIDTTVIRVIFVLGLFLGLASLIVYIVLWIMVPKEP